MHISKNCLGNTPIRTGTRPKVSLRAGLSGTTELSLIEAYKAEPYRCFRQYKSMTLSKTESKKKEK